MAFQLMNIAMEDDSSEEELFKRMEDQRKTIGKLMFHRLQRELNNQPILSLEPLYQNKKLIGILAITNTQNYEFLCETRFIPYIARHGRLYNNNLYHACQEEKTCRCTTM